MSDFEMKVLFYMYSRMCAGNTYISAREIMKEFGVPYCIAKYILEKLYSDGMVRKVPTHPFCRSN